MTTKAQRDKIVESLTSILPIALIVLALAADGEKEENLEEEKKE